MSRYNHQRQLSKRSYVFRLLGAIIAIAILTAAIPRGQIIGHRYSIGEPWNHSSLIAEESFPIYKSDSMLKAERDSLRAHYKPIFNIDNGVMMSQVQKFDRMFQANFASNTPYRYRRYVEEKMRHIYETGLITSTDLASLTNGNVESILISENNEAHQRKVTSLFTQKTAYEYITQPENASTYNKNILQSLGINEFLEPNITLDKVKTDQQLQNVEKSLVLIMGQVKEGEKIVDRGQIVDAHTYQLLQSWDKYQKGTSHSGSEGMSILFGHLLYTCIMVICLVFFIKQFRSDYLEEMRIMLLIAIMTMVFPLITYALAASSVSMTYMIPYCILPIFIRIFLDSRTATITHMSSIMASAIVVSNPFEFIVIQTVAGLVAIYSLRTLSQRSELFRAMFFVTGASLFTHLSFDLIHLQFSGNGNIVFQEYVHIIVSGFLLLISYLLLFPIERIFKFTSSVTLVELSNTNNEILRRLSEEAPGTFQHSMQVANLAAEVANKIGAKSQLVRTGAMYHDIGKLKNPAFFTENQNGSNPHDNISRERSAQIIIDHVRYGLQLAEKYQLPKVIKDFIATHHATSTTKFFLISYKNEHPHETVNESLFTYPGPNPRTQEQAILMMADAVEAASRSLKSYSEEELSNLVDRIIDSQVQEGYFNLCPITFEDITTAKSVFKTKLKTIYHTRISYPELKFPN